ncbi:hypothetical protein SAMN04488074_105349 [Lentzea albidocapillata subsp. violacea]|uniref:SAV-6107-like HEPN domain-containing protein n=1 Tax=Lentzea albidocapillata subsp. violacea TaxID=128104 RepID=A0A1G9BKR6_9PSEU|nr:SAV_6107 family HEPN domain-containing protein [Lentzea albidocapillata]SDK39724.1 hypothetical protein SAMN04488074_105349 [Lentzea albidocapillata subsp. violacea]
MTADLSNPAAFPIPLPPASALVLLRQAHDSLAESERTPEPPERFAAAYLAALRAAAAVLALRGRPHRGRSRPTSAWVLLAAMAPEMSEWAAFFASWSSTRAAVLAGITRHVNARTADDLVRQTHLFVALVDRVMSEAQR